VPALAIEIISPSNTAGAMERKIDEWFGAGVERLWVVYPETRRVYDYESPSKCTILGVGQSLSGGTVLPGLEIPVDVLFE
jgi:Uma2 family endonuclease